MTTVEPLTDSTRPWDAIPFRVLERLRTESERPTGAHSASNHNVYCMASELLLLRNLLRKQSRDATNAMYAAVGFINGKSIQTKEGMIAWLVETIKAIEAADTATNE